MDNAPERRTVELCYRTSKTLVNAVYTGCISIDDVPTDLRAEIEMRVITRLDEQKDDEATEEDYQAALAEMGVMLGGE